MTQRISLFIALVAFCAVGFSGSSAKAQASRRSAGRRYQNATAEPYVSPYLNLMRPGADPGLNYATLVQPQLQQQRNSQLQNQQIQTLNRDVQQQQQAVMSPYGPVGGIHPTGGRVASRGNYSHYYPRLGAGGTTATRNYPNPVGTAGGFGMGGFGMGGFGMGGGF